MMVTTPADQNFMGRECECISYTTVVVYSRDDQEVGFLAPIYQ